VNEIDIMMPCYGEFALLQAAVQSVREQTEQSWHLTVIDDGNHAEVPGWFAGLGDTRITYTRNAENLGINRNFQKCVDLATRDHLVMMGSDDIMAPDYVATIQRLIAEYPKAALIQPGVVIIDETGAESRTLVDTAKRRIYAPRVSGTEVLGGEKLAISLLRGNWLYFPSLCWRREPMAEFGFRPRLEVIQDLALILDLVERGEQLVVDTSSVCFRYRRHSASESSAQAVDGRRFAEAREYFLALADRLERAGWPDAAKAARRHTSTRIHALTQVPIALRAGQVGNARVLVKYAVARAPRAS
jgi:glycosyltransferase involved in cell wall biosynthesis